MDIKDFKHNKEFDEYEITLNFAQVHFESFMNAWFNQDIIYVDGLDSGLIIENMSKTVLVKQGDINSNKICSNGNDFVMNATFFLKMVD